jgi:putative ABC transport system permease protein
MRSPRWPPRWQKIRRDLWTSRGRMALMTVAVAAGLFALGSTLGGYAVLSRELTRAYRSTRPASATLETDAVDAALLAEVRRQPGIAAAEARATVRARVRVGEDWRPVLLFVVPDFQRMRLATFARVAGDWPPPRGTMLIDHMALSLVDVEMGETVTLKTPRTPHGAPVPVRLSGVVWDSSLPPAGMERTVWGYVTPETLALLGETGGLDQLKIITAGNPMDTAAIEATARGLAGWLEAHGHPVREIQIPPPGKHPHQGQMTAVMLMLNLFAVLALLLSGVLVGTTVEAMMARQVREIGVMKAVGAGTGQIARLYLAMMLVLGVGALVLAVPSSLWAARALAGMAAYNLNIKIASAAVPGWVLALVCAAGLLVPLLAAAVPVGRASRTTVQNAIHDSGTPLEAFGARRFDAWLSRRSGLSPLLALGMRNAFRRRGRLILTLGLLAAGGAMFLAGRDTAAAWKLRLAEVRSGRKYDVAIRFQQPEPAAKALAVARGVPGVTSAEAWSTAPAAWGDETGLHVAHTYPDKGHGSFQVTGLPADTKLVRFPVLAGRWLHAGDDGVAVLNHSAAAAVPDAKVGGTVTISVEGRPQTWRIVGFVRDLGSPATVYVPSPTLARATGTPDTTELLYVACGGGERDEVIRRVESSLEEAGMGIDVSIPVTLLRSAVGGHMAVLLGLLSGLSGLMTLVGVLGLAAAMSTGVVERTRELGVMQAVGASPSLVLRVVLAEGIFIGLLSSVLAVALALPLTALVGGILGRLAFRVPLPLVVAPGAVFSWLAIVLAGSALATAVPAWRASRMTVREALAFD